MNVFLISAGLIVLGEVGDKTQLLAVLLAARFQRPWPIVAGIVVATLVNHTVAGAVGAWVAAQLGAQTLRWVIGAIFLAMAAWMLVPEAPAAEHAPPRSGLGVFGATLVSFFLAEMGDKTQIATVALAARYHDLVAVVAGTTLGMLIADVPAVFIGDRLAMKLPLRWVRGAAGALFAALGIATLLNVGHLF